MGRFVGADREQAFLLAPDMREWLPGDHLAWFVIDVVDQIDLTGFERSYRDDGHGRPPYDPAMMVGLLLYAYCTGVRSSRAIERRCVEDVAFRVLAAGLRPDHVTIARFRARHAKALAGVLVASLRLCAEAGLVKLGVVALDGTKMPANASAERNRTLAWLEQQIKAILAEAEQLDAAEAKAEQQQGALPDGLADPVTRRRRLQAARERLEAAKARLEATAAARAQAFAERSDRLNAARATKGLPPKEYTPRRVGEAPQPEATTNLTDPDSRVLLGRRGRVQGYNAQLVTTAEQIIVAAEVTQAGNDVDQLAPMLTATRATLTAAGMTEPVQALVADAGYWKAANVDGSIPDLPELYVVVAKHGRRGKPRKDGKPAGDTTGHLVQAMQTKLATPAGKQMLRVRRTTVEPLFGQTKTVRGIDAFARRGLPAVQTEWQLIAATSNLLKLHRHRLASQ